MKFRLGAILLLCGSQVGGRGIKLSDPLSVVMCLFEHVLGGFSAALTALGTGVLSVFPEWMHQAVLCPEQEVMGRLHLLRPGHGEYNEGIISDATFSVPLALGGSADTLHLGATSHLLRICCYTSKEAHTLVLSIVIGVPHRPFE